MIRRRPRSLRARVTAFGFATLLIVLGLGAWVTVRALSAALRDDLGRQNDEVLDALADAITDGADPQTLRIPVGADGTDFLIVDDELGLINASALPFVPSEQAFAELPDDAAIALGDANGFVAGEIVVVDALPPAGAVFGGPALALPEGFADELFVVDFDENDFVEAGDWFETSRQVATPEGDELTLLAFTPVGVVDRSVDRLGWTMVVLVPLLAAAGGLALWRAVGAALRPVGAIAEEARRIAPSRSGGRLPVPESGDEIAELTDTLNGMLDRLDAGLIRQREFVSDASHELRSPLTVVRGATELLSMRELPDDAEPTVERLQRGVDRLELVLDDLTQLASAGESDGQAPLDVAELVRREVEHHRDGGIGRIELELGDLPEATIVASEVQVSRAIDNLLSNAVRHAASRVRIEVRSDAAAVEVVVDDDGPGIPADDRERIFERFVRLDDGRARRDGGSGLGLALVASIAADHRGDVRCEAGPLGGARFVLRLAATRP